MARVPAAHGVAMESRETQDARAAACTEMLCHPSALDGAQFAKNGWLPVVIWPRE